MKLRLLATSFHAFSVTVLSLYSFFDLSYRQGYTRTASLTSSYSCIVSCSLVMFVIFFIRRSTCTQITYNKIKRNSHITHFSKLAIFYEKNHYFENLCSKIVGTLLCQAIENDKYENFFIFSFLR